MEINIVPVEGNTARKKIRNKSQWKRNVKRRERSATATRKYVPSDLNIKKMWKMYQTNQQDESLKVNMSTLKITDVEKLLTKHFGGNWQSNEQLSFNKNILETNSDGGVNVEQSDEPCEHLEEAPAEDRQVTEGQAEGTELKYDRFPPRSEENDYYRSCRGLTEGLAGSSEQVTDGSQPTPRARGERVPSSRARSQNTTQDIRGVCSHDAEHGTKRD
ncbi:unnamed protein product [Diatraea saccharalis]|uniref:Uncharacterized protein n=1 Tax=Diatraea saccharalis TaxID=40085 RepID=A0A9N9RAE6_9NEOP|nr:unnamed protein product [Diatraea saccharalis]